MELWQAYKTIRRRWWLIAALTLMGLGVGVIVTLAEGRTYRATGTVNTGATRSTEWGSGNARVADVQAVLTSRSLMTQVRDEIQWEKRQEELERAIRVTRLPDSNVFRIDVIMSDPQKAVIAANTLVAGFIQFETERLREDAQREVVILREQFDAAKARLQRAQEEYNKTSALRESDTNRMLAQEELGLARQNYNTVFNQIQKTYATITNPAAANQVFVLDKPTLPTEPQPSNAPRLITFGALIGLFVGLFFAIAMQYLDSMPRLLEVIQSRLSVPILAVVPWERHFGKTFYPPLNKVGDQRREAYRLLRSNLMLTRRTLAPDLRERFADRPLLMPQSIMVAADEPGAGCSVTATNLGVTLANANQRVVLIDANTIDPSLHRHCHVNGDRGLIDLLRDTHRSPEEFIQPTEVPNLFILPAGQPDATASDLLAEREIADLTHALAETYDVIIVDCAALKISSDARLLGDAVDSIIAVVRPAGADADEKARNLVHFAGQKLAGVVLNGLDLPAGVVVGLATPKHPNVTPIAERVRAAQHHAAPVRPRGASTTG